MTIKPIITPGQKRSASDEKKESNNSNGHGHVHGSHAHSHGHNIVEPNSNTGQNNGRTNSTYVQCRAGQSPQRRVETFDDMNRQRRSPHKSSRSKRREHHELLQKRERGEREKLTAVSVSNNSISNKCGSPHAHGSDLLGATTGINAVNNSTGKGGIGPSSPTDSTSTGGNSTEHLAAIPVVLGCQSPKSTAALTQVTGNLIKAVEETYSGYNSGDEHLQPKESAISADEWQQRDDQFAKCMAGRGYELRPVEEDGACLFRSISLQIYGDEGMHDVVRQHTMDYIYKNREYFSQFVTEDINSYIKRKRRKDSHGNHIEIQAMSEIYNRPVEVYCYKSTPINIFNSEQLNKGYAPLRLSYQRGSHYNAIIDPYDATVGVGLGLAGHKPELQTKEAVLLSEQMEIEQTMFEDKLKTTDWEATNEAIEEQIARESYLQWCRENLQKNRSATTAASTSATVTSAEAASDSEASPSKYSIQRNKSTNLSITATGNFNNKATHTVVGKAPQTVTKVNTFEENLSGSVESAHLSTNSKSTAPLEKELTHGVNIITTVPYSVGERDLDSDDTDMSSTSSLGASSSASGTIKSKALKTRSATLRVGGKRRRCESNAIRKGKSAVVANHIAYKSPKHENEDVMQLLKVNSRSHTPEADQQPCTSKQSCTSTPEKNLPKFHDSGEDVLSASTSKCTLPSCTSTPPKSIRSVNQELPSNFYQELLEASYAADGFGQLTESEMLQRAIQLSTQDYIDEQKRKYLFGP